MVSKKRTRTESAMDKKIEAIYYKRCSGIAVPILKISEIFEAGRVAIMEGLDDEALGDRILEATQRVAAGG